MVSGLGSSSPRALRSSASWRAFSAAASRSACLRAARSACSCFKREAVIALPSRSTPRSKRTPKIADSGAKGSWALTFLYPISPKMARIIRKTPAQISAEAHKGTSCPRRKISRPIIAMTMKHAKTAATARKAAPLPRATPLVLSSCFAIWTSSLTWLIPRVLSTLAASKRPAILDLIPAMPARMPWGLVFVVMPTSP